MTAQEQPDPSDAIFARARGPLLGAIALVTLGLGIAGTIDRATGGVLVVAAWVLGVFALHRLGRAGSQRS